MAFNFDSGQFNKESTPKRLGNWEVPRWAPTRARPLEMRPDPKPICDINGHFLPGAPRGTSRCFGHYTGTWELPRKITRKVAEELAKEPPNGRFPDWLNLRVQRPKAGTARLRAEKRGKLKKEPGQTELQDQDVQTFEVRRGGPRAEEQVVLTAAAAAKQAEAAVVGVTTISDATPMPVSQTQKEKNSKNC